MRKKSNASLSGGLVGFFVMILIHLLAIFIGNGYNRWDFIIWLIQLFLYFFVANFSGEKQYNLTKDTYRSVKGIASAATGATVITSIMVWLFLLIRYFILVNKGKFIYQSGVAIIFWVLIDLTMAFVIGNIVGRNVEKRHEGFTSWIE